MTTNTQPTASPEAQPTGSGAENLSSNAQGFYLVVGVVIGLCLAPWLDLVASVYERLP